MVFKVGGGSGWLLACPGPGPLQSSQVLVISLLAASRRAYVGADLWPKTPNGEQPAAGPGGRQRPYRPRAASLGFRADSLHRDAALPYVVGCAVVRRWWPPQEVGGSGGVDGPAGEVVCLAGTSRQGTCRTASRYPQRPSLSQTAWRARLRYLSGGSSLSLFLSFFAHTHTRPLGRRCSDSPRCSRSASLGLPAVHCPLAVHWLPTRCPLAAHRPFLGPLPFSLSPLTPPPLSLFLFSILHRQSLLVTASSPSFPPLTLLFFFPLSRSLDTSSSNCHIGTRHSFRVHSFPSALTLPQAHLHLLHVRDHPALAAHNSLPFPHPPVYGSGRHSLLTYLRGLIILYIPYTSYLFHFCQSLDLSWPSLVRIPR